MDTFHGQHVIFYRKEVPVSVANFIHVEFCVFNGFCIGLVLKSLSESNFYFLPFLPPFHTLHHCLEWHTRGIKPSPQYSEDQNFRGYWGTLQAARQKAEQFAKSLLEEFDGAEELYEYLEYAYIGLEDVLVEKLGWDVKDEI